MSTSPAAPRNRKRRRVNANRVGILAMSDLDAWPCLNEQILAATLSTWISPVYAHYEVSIDRHTKSPTRPNGSIDPEVPDYMEFKFTCKTDPSHSPVYRRRNDTKRGTGNLLIIRRFNKSYKHTTSDRNANTQVDSDDSDVSNDEWPPENSPAEPNKGNSAIETYLRGEPIHREVVKKVRGPLGYWELQLAVNPCPELAQFAIDYLSAPASSVDVERAFSCSRLMTKHIQHQMSTDTFGAKMALKSWYKTPLLPDVSDIASLLANRPPTPSSEN
ncbi:hAT family dimerization protein [Ceratobasidium sp. AG-Ba]|nr:hAT family dimerization protein [Ceratobasidium sp. AG-Ba]